MILKNHLAKTEGEKKKTKQKIVNTVKAINILKHFYIKLIMARICAVRIRYYANLFTDYLLQCSEQTLFTDKKTESKE